MKVNIPPHNRVQPRMEILDLAKTAVTDREKQYASPDVNYTRVAAIVQVILQEKLRDSAQLSPADMVLINLAIKMSRLIEKPDHKDTQVDIAGYASLMSEVV